MAFYNTISEKHIMCFMDYETTGIDCSPADTDYPIEVACLFTDYKFREIERYTSLITWGEFHKYDRIWPDQYQFAYNVHKIELEQVCEHGKTVEQIQWDITGLIAGIQDELNSPMKPIIISDAPNFEMFFTQKIFGWNRNKLPFHYNAWSVYPLFPIFGYHIPNKPHNAMDDTVLLHQGMQEIQKAMDILNGDE